MQENQTDTGNKWNGINIFWGVFQNTHPALDGLARRVEQRYQEEQTRLKDDKDPPPLPDEEYLKESKLYGDMIALYFSS